MSDFTKGMCKKWAWQCKPGMPALGRWRQENGVQGYRLQTKTGHRRQSHLLFSLAFTLGFFKAIIKKKKKLYKSIQKSDNTREISQRKYSIRTEFSELLLACLQPPMEDFPCFCGCYTCEKAGAEDFPLNWVVCPTLFPMNSRKDFCHFFF